MAHPRLSPRGSISVDDRTNVMIVRDVRGNLNQIEELSRALDTQTPQGGCPVGRPGGTAPVAPQRSE